MKIMYPKLFTQKISQVEELTVFMPSNVIWRLPISAIAVIFEQAFYGKHPLIANTTKWASVAQGLFKVDLNAGP